MNRRSAITLFAIPAILCTSIAFAQDASKTPVPPPPPPESPGNIFESGGSQDSQKAAGEQESSDAAEKAGQTARDASETRSKLKFPVGGFKGKGLMGLPPLAIDKQLGLENAEANKGEQANQAAVNRNVEANRNRRPQNAAGNAMPNNRMRVNPGMGNFGGMQPPVFMPGYNPNRPYGYPYGYYPSYPWRYYGYGHGVWNPGVIVGPSAPGASNYFGNPHGSQYFGNPHASQGVGRVGK